MIHLWKPQKGTTTSYSGYLLSADASHLLVHARWERPRLELGYVTFETGDHFYEHYYTDRWYNVFELRSEAGQLKGWYCNICRPALVTGNDITSEDLDLDLFVSPDRSQLLVLDEDEFESRDFAQREPVTYAASLAAMEELMQLARQGLPPFESQPDA